MKIRLNCDVFYGGMNKAIIEKIFFEIATRSLFEQTDVKKPAKTGFEEAKKV